MLELDELNIHFLLQAGNSLKSLMDSWSKGCLLDYDGSLEVDSGTVVKATLDFLADKLGISKMALDFAWSISDDQGTFLIFDFLLRITFISQNIYRFL